MAGLNLVQIIGNLGRDPEMRFVANGNAVVNFPVAVSRSFGSGEERKEETEWFNVVAWGKLAEQANQYLQKGRKVYVSGRLATRSWDDNEGVKRYKTEVIANEIQFLDTRQVAVGAGGEEDDTDVGNLPFE